MSGHHRIQRFRLGVVLRLPPIPPMPHQFRSLQYCGLCDASEARERMDRLLALARQLSKIARRVGSARVEKPNSHGPPSPTEP